jgi:hypothetical protein
MGPPHNNLPHVPPANPTQLHTLTAPQHSNNSTFYFPHSSVLKAHLSIYLTNRASLPWILSVSLMANGAVTACMQWPLSYIIIISASTGPKASLLSLSLSIYLSHSLSFTRIWFIYCIRNANEMVAIYKNDAANEKCETEILSSRINFIFTFFFPSTDSNVITTVTCNSMHRLHSPVR